MTERITKPCATDFLLVFGRVDFSPRDKDVAAIGARAADFVRKLETTGVWSADQEEEADKIMNAIVRLGNETIQEASEAKRRSDVMFDLHRMFAMAAGPFLDVGGESDD